VESDQIDAMANINARVNKQRELLREVALQKNQLETLKSVAESKDNKGGAGAGASGAAGGKKKGDKPGAGAAGQRVV
jgi:hypothetical protein